MESSPLFLEIPALYASGKDAPNVMSVRLRMRDPIDGEILRKAVDAATARYPYFCVELKKQDRGYVFEKNDRPVVLTNSEKGVELNSAASNYHLLSLSWHGNRFVLYMSHALTDGTGIYRFLYTLLYYYISGYYKIKPDCPGVWLVTDPIEEEELADPSLKTENVPVHDRDRQPAPAFNVIKKANLQNDTEKTVHSIVVSESEFMRFNFSNEGSPAAMIALMLSRSIADSFPGAKETIRVNVLINLRKGTNTPRSYHGLVGGIPLEYMDRIREWPLEKQMIAYRGRLIAGSTQEKLLANVSGIKRVVEKLLSLETDAERASEAAAGQDMARDQQTATISYVRKAAFGEVEQYIEEFHVWVPAVYENVLLEMTAVNGRMFVDFIQNFADRRFFDAFLRQLSQNGIAYQYRSSDRLELPGVRLPWI